MSKMKISLVIAVVVLALGLAGFFIFKDIKNTNVLGSSIEPMPTEASNQSPAPTGPQAKTDERLLNQLKTQALDREIIVKANLPDDLKNKTITEIKDLSLQLSREPNYLQGWLQIGISRKFLGDYEGASLAWQYAVAMRPGDIIAYLDLGDLYAHYLKDYPKAEKYLRQAVTIKPDYISGYKDLSELYRYAYKEKSNMVVPILLEGIQKNPQGVDLMVALASYYKDQGDKTNAKKYYEEALALNLPQAQRDSINEELKNI